MRDGKVKTVERRNIDSLSETGLPIDIVPLVNFNQTRSRGEFLVA